MLFFCLGTFKRASPSNLRSLLFPRSKTDFPVLLGILKSQAFLVFLQYSHYILHIGSESHVNHLLIFGEKEKHFIGLKPV
jgi:hypothetical protein